ncbi:MAG: group II intron reverse transcriptase/maturase [Planctomycetes bacterium]|nr:group II intron reverse transcriptase/maturase [Planctomycetota bacterium]
MSENVMGMCEYGEEEVVELSPPECRHGFLQAHRLRQAARARVSKKQEGLRGQVEENWDREFAELYDMVCDQDTLWVAWFAVHKNDGACGVDEETIEAVERQGVSSFLESLSHDLRVESYVATPVRREYIPKDSGDLRPLGIPTVRDRVVQTAVNLVLEAIFEADFLPCSFGFRPGKSIYHAVAQIRRLLRKDLPVVFEADITKFFDRMDQGLLLDAVRRRVSDERILALISMWLKIGALDHGILQPSTTGTPQGGVISPLLANIYLHALDSEIRTRSKGRFYLVRYADDFVIPCRAGASVEAECVVREIMSGLILELHPRKTGMRDVSSGFDFLGFTFQVQRAAHGRRAVLIRPAKESVDRFISDLATVSTKCRRPKGRRSPPPAPLDAYAERLRSWVGHVGSREVNGVKIKVDSYEERKRVAEAAIAAFPAFARLRAPTSHEAPSLALIEETVRTICLKLIACEGARAKTPSRSVGAGTIGSGAASEA